MLNFVVSKALGGRRRAHGVGGEWRLKLRADADVSAEIRGEIAAVDSRVPTIGFEGLLVVPENDLNVALGRAEQSPALIGPVSILQRTQDPARQRHAC